MNTAVELHDSVLSAITHEGASVVLVFSPAYLHRSSGRPGIDAGSGWSQVISLAFADAFVSAAPELPRTLAGGWLLAGGTRHDNVVSTDGTFEVPCELALVLVGSETVLVHGSSLTVRRHGTPTYIEEFTPRVADP